MSVITENVVTSIEYRRSARELMFSATPGKIVVHVFGLYSQAEVEEYIDTLRKAAIEAKLPVALKKED